MDGGAYVCEDGRGEESEERLSERKWGEGA